MLELPASIGQRLLWHLDYYRGGDGGTLNCPVVCRMRGPLNTQVLSAALEDLIARHEALRTILVRRGRAIHQVIGDPKPQEIAFHDYSELETPHSSLEKALTEELQTRIPPDSGPVRVSLHRESQHDHTLCVNIHHLATDAWSCGVILNDLLSFMKQRVNPGMSLPATGWQYSQFTRWQEESAQAACLKPHAGYWMNQLQGAHLPDLPLRTLHDESLSRQSARESLEIPVAVADLLRSLAREKKTTAFNVMLSIYYALLRSITGDDDLVVASLFANRPIPQLQHTVGFLANMVLLRTRLRKASRFADVLSSTHRTVMDAFLHQAVSYYTLSLDLIHDGSRRSDDVVFQMMPEVPAHANIGDLDIEVIVPEGIGSRFELELVLVPRQGKFKAILFYNAARLEANWARSFLRAYAQVAAAVAGNNDISLSDLPKIAAGAF